jgi:hypothetical protein
MWNFHTVGVGLRDLAGYRACIWIAAIALTKRGNVTYYRLRPSTRMGTLFRWIFHERYSHRQRSVPDRARTEVTSVSGSFPGARPPLVTATATTQESGNDIYVGRTCPLRLAANILERFVNEK